MSTADDWADRLDDWSKAMAEHAKMALKKAEEAKALPKEPNLNCLSHWFPKLEIAGLPVPKTVILKMDEECQAEIWKAFDGKGDNAEPFNKFVAAITGAVGKVGYPAFLRTGQFSGKHNWQDTCFIKDSSVNIGHHVYQICEMSEMFGMFGELPWDVWAVREFLPTKPIGVCERYGNMPVCKEFRFFVSDQQVKCLHPYWPTESLDQGRFKGNVSEGWYERFCECPSYLNRLASEAGKAVGRDWSVDLLETANGYFITDMAIADRSYHWPTCPNCPEHKRH